MRIIQSGPHPYLLVYSQYRVAGSALQKFRLSIKYQSSGLNDQISLELSLPSWDSPTKVSSMSPHYKWLSCRSLTSLLLDCLRYNTSSSEPHNWIPFSVIQQTKLDAYLPIRNVSSLFQFRHRICHLWFWWVGSGSIPNTRRKFSWVTGLGHRYSNIRKSMYISSIFSLSIAKNSKQALFGIIQY